MVPSVGEFTPAPPATPTTNVLDEQEVKLTVKQVAPKVLASLQQDMDALVANLNDRIESEVQRRVAAEESTLVDEAVRQTKAIADARGEAAVDKAVELATEIADCPSCPPCEQEPCPACPECEKAPPCPAQAPCPAAEPCVQKPCPAAEPCIQKPCPAAEPCPAPEPCQTGPAYRLGAQASVSGPGAPKRPPPSGGFREPPPGELSRVEEELANERARTTRLEWELEEKDKELSQAQEEASRARQAARDAVSALRAETRAIEDAHARLEASFDTLHERQPQINSTATQLAADLADLPRADPEALAKLQALHNELLRDPENQVPTRYSGPPTPALPPVTTPPPRPQAQVGPPGPPWTGGTAGPAPPPPRPEPVVPLPTAALAWTELPAPWRDLPPPPALDGPVTLGPVLVTPSPAPPKVALLARAPDVPTLVHAVAGKRAALSSERFAVETRAADHLSSAVRALAEGQADRSAFRRLAAAIRHLR